jgi:hypothetical protein
LCCGFGNKISGRENAGQDDLAGASEEECDDSTQAPAVSVVILAVKVKIILRKRWGDCISCRSGGGRLEKCRLSMVWQ